MEKIISKLKSIFVKKGDNKNSLDIDSNILSVNGKTYMPAKLLKVQKAFNQQYLEIKNDNNLTLDSFKKNIIILIIQNIKKTEYGKQEDFMLEIKFFLHYLFLVIEDDFNYGDKILKEKIIELDNYIFSQYRKLKNLEKNINKLIALSKNERFMENPKENILSYFVFLEENGVEIVDIIDDFFHLLNGNVLSEKEEKKKSGSNSLISKNKKEENTLNKKTFSTQNQNLNTMYTFEK